MPSSLTQAQLAGLRAELKARFDALREEVRQELLQSDEEQYVALAGSVWDPADASTADLLADVNLAVIDRHINEIRTTEAALLRIAKGVYGLCGDCEEPIAFERLSVYPTAQRCYRCQTLHEKSYLQPQHASL